MGFHTARNDALGEIAGVFLEGFDRAGLQHGDVVVVNRGGFREYFLLRHRHQQPRRRDPARPFFPKLRPPAPQVRHQFRQQRLGTRFLGLLPDRCDRERRSL